MPSFGAISRSDLIRYLKQIGFDGPFPILEENINT